VLLGIPPMSEDPRPLEGSPASEVDRRSIGQGLTVSRPVPAARDARICVQLTPMLCYFVKDSMRATLLAVFFAPRG